MSAKIERRDDVNPAVGERKYGDVEFADPTNRKYPIDTPQHMGAAWNYIHHEANVAKYDAKYDVEEVASIQERIQSAAKQHGTEILEEEDR